MVTIATPMVCEMLASSRLGSEFNLQLFVAEGQMSSDKKASAGAILAPRGVETMAWGTLTNSVCGEILGVSSYLIYRGLMYGKEAGIRNGQFGSNMNTSNVVAAMFIARQDAACFVDSCWNHLVGEYDMETEDLKISIYFPYLPVGVIRGDTGYGLRKNVCRSWVARVRV